MSDKTDRVFFRNNDSGECAAYCGSLSNRDEVLKAIGYILAADLEELPHQGSIVEGIDYSLLVVPMTDAEVEALPDM